MNPCLFKNKTKLTPMLLKDWLDFYYGKIQKGKIIKNTIISLIMFIMGILLFCYRRENMDLYFSLLWMVLGIFLFLYSIISPRIHKRNQIIHFVPTTFNYEFYRDSFKIDGKTIHTEILYSRVARVYETEKYFYLYLYSQVVYVVEKKEDVEKFREFLKENMKHYKDYR